ncbi:hypothetical protein [Lucifera butyrica]|nr:hypothetical protein [Lucifera butyrica]
MEALVKEKGTIPSPLYWLYPFLMEGTIEREQMGWKGMLDEKN